MKQKVAVTMGLAICALAGAPVMERAAADDPFEAPPGVPFCDPNQPYLRQPIHYEGNPFTWPTGPDEGFRVSPIEGTFAFLEHMGGPDYLGTGILGALCLETPSLPPVKVGGP